MLNELHEFFDDLEKEFPYSTMGKEFNGHHAIYKDDDGKLKLLLWLDKRAYRIPLDAEFNELLHNLWAVINLKLTATGFKLDKKESTPSKDKSGRFKKIVDKK